MSRKEQTSANSRNKKARPKHDRVGSIARARKNVSHFVFTLGVAVIRWKQRVEGLCGDTLRMKSVVGLLFPELPVITYMNVSGSAYFIHC